MWETRKIRNSRSEESINTWWTSRTRDCMIESPVHVIAGDVSEKSFGTPLGYFSRCSSCCLLFHSCPFGSWRGWINAFTLSNHRGDMRDDEVKCIVDILWKQAKHLNQDVSEAFESRCGWARTSQGRSRLFQQRFLAAVYQTNQARKIGKRHRCPATHAVLSLLRPPTPAPSKNLNFVCT